MGRLEKPPDIEAEIHFLPTEAGGRQSPVYSGYHPDHDMQLADTLNGAKHRYLDVEQVAPGDTVRAEMWFLAPELQQGRLFEGMRFTVQEGPTIVAWGRILCVLNPTLRLIRN